MSWSLTNRKIYDYDTPDDPQQDVVPSGLSESGKLIAVGQEGSWIYRVGSDERQRLQLNVEGTPKVWGLSSCGRWVSGVVRIDRASCGLVETAFLHDLEKGKTHLFTENEPYYRQAFSVNTHGMSVGFGHHGYAPQKCEAWGNAGLAGSSAELKTLKNGVSPYHITNDGFVVGRYREEVFCRHVTSDEKPKNFHRPGEFIKSVGFQVSEGGKLVAGAAAQAHDGQLVWYPALWEDGQCRILKGPSGQRMPGLCLGVNSQGLAVGALMKTLPRSWRTSHARHTRWPQLSRCDVYGEAGNAALWLPGEDTAQQLGSWFDNPQLCSAAFLTEKNVVAGYLMIKGRARAYTGTITKA